MYSVYSLPSPESPHRCREPAAGDGMRKRPGEGSTDFSSRSKHHHDYVNACREVSAPTLPCILSDWEKLSTPAVEPFLLGPGHRGGAHTHTRPPTAIRRAHFIQFEKFEDNLIFFQNLLFLGEQFRCIHKAWILFSFLKSCC